MSLEPFTTLIAARQMRTLMDPRTAQQSLLHTILTSSRGTAAARALGLSGSESFDDFLDVPPRDYSFYEPIVEQAFTDPRAFGAEPIVAFGETSGSLGRPKLIPHTAASLKTIGAFAERVLLFQLAEGKHYFPQLTKWLAVTASTHVRVERGMPIGFISALMYQAAQQKRRKFVLPTPAVAAITDWDERLRKTVDEAWDKKLGTMLGVPAYLCRFLDAAAERADGTSLGTVWPMLGRVCYSGTSIEPYRERMERALGRRLIIRALYTATEGSFGAELDPRAPGEIHLMSDMTVFTFRDVRDPGSRMLAAWEVVRGGQYEVCVTTLSGLIQYQIGDVLEVTETRPLRVRVVGRAADEINLATEKVSLAQAREVMTQVVRQARISGDHFMVVPDPANARRHLWIVECLDGVDETAVADLVDAALSSINPSYRTLRQGGAVLERPRVIALPAGRFDEYLRAGFSTRGQFKFRHLFPSADTLLETPGLGALEPFIKDAGSADRD